MTSIKNMPDDAKVWVYQCNRTLTDTEVAEITSLGNTFVTGWAAHGAALNASFEIFYNLFIVLAVDEKQALASGCSIDSSVHFIKSIENKFNLNLFDRMQVAYRKGNEIHLCQLNNLSSELTQNFGNNIAEVIVFNNMVTNKTDFGKKWEVALKNSWQNRVLA